MARSNTVTVTVTAPGAEYSLKVMVLSNSAAIAGATVKVDSTERTTDSQGMADFGTMAGGTYSVMVMATNYKTFTGTLTLDGDIIYNVTLEPLVAVLPQWLWYVVGGGAVLGVGAVAAWASRRR